MKLKPKLHTLALSFGLLSGLQSGYSQDFDKHFADSTLRLDFTFSGTNKSVHISTDAMHLSPGWYGRRHNLDKLPLEGTGRITMRALQSGKVLYRHSFSSLFQEWLSTPEASERSRSYENVYLVPFPREKVVLDIELEDMKRNVIVQNSLQIDPNDILIHRPAHRSPYRVTELHRGGNSRDAIDVVFLAEGYREAEMADFLKHAEQACRELLNYAPFHGEHKKHFNIFAVETPSIDSGVSTPRQGNWKRTAFSSHFDTFYSDRYLTIPRIKAMHDALQGIPYEHIIVLANTDIYGGGGIYNSYTLGSVHHKWFLPVIVHEFGHSFAGLADEYFYDDDAMTDAYSKTIEPWEQNVTTLIDFQGKKWNKLIPRATPRPTLSQHKEKHPVGLYEGGAYSKHGIYRASYDCRMRTNETPDFCVACRKAITELIRFYVP